MKMNSFSRKAISVGLVLATALWFAGSSLAPLANAAGLTSSQVQSILALLQSFGADQATINNVNAALTGQAVTTPSTGSTSMTSYTFTHALTVGSKGADVKALQQFLNAKGYTVAQSGAGSPGNESMYFGPATKAALAAFQKANSISPAAGYFGPVTMKAVNAMEGTVTTGSGTTITVPSGTGLMVSLASDNPAGGNIASGAVNQPLLALNFTAGAQSVTVNSLQLIRGGLSQDSDLLNVYLYEGGNRLATNLGISNGVINFNQSSGLFTVPAGQTVTIDVTADITGGSNANNTGHVITISLPSAQSVTATQAVSGTFPIVGNAMTIAQVNLAQLQFNNSSVGTTSANYVSVNAGQMNNLIGTFSLQAGADPVKITSIRFTETGSIPTNDIQNVKLMNGSTQVGGTLQSMNGNIALFDLSNAPLMLAAGQSATLNLYADVSAGVGYYFQFTIQQASDIQAVDTMYNVGIGATAMSYGTNFPQNLSYEEVQPGGLVLTPASSTGLYVVSGNTNSILAQYSLLASGDNIRVQQVAIHNYSGNWTGLQNIQVFLNGAQIGTVQPSVSSDPLTIPNLNYTIPANTSVSLVVEGTVTSTAGTVQLGAQVQGQQQSNYASVTTGSGYIPAPGLQIQAAGSNLTASANPSFGSPTISAGASPAEIGSFILQAGQVNPVTFAGATLQVVNMAQSGDLSNLYVQVNGSNYASTYGSIADNGSYAFNGSPMTIQPNGTLQINVYATIGLNATETSTLVKLTGVNATAGSNAVSLTGAPFAGQVVTITPGAVLAASDVSLDPNSTQSTTTMGMGVGPVTLGIFRLTATSTPITVTQLTFVDASTTGTTTPSGAPGTFTGLSLAVSGQTTPIATQYGGFGSNGQAVFSMVSPLTVPQNGYVSVQLVGTVPSYNSYSAAEGVVHYIGLIGAVSQVASGASSTSVSAYAPAIAVYKTVPVAFAGSNSLPTGSNISPAVSVSAGGYVGAFSVTAGTGGDVYVKSFTFQQSGAMLGTSTVVDYSFYAWNGTSLSNVLGTAVATGTAATTSVSFSNPWDVPAGTTQTLVVKITNAPVTSPQTNPVTFTVSVTGGLTWGDGTSGSYTNTALPSNVTFPQNSTMVTSNS